MPSHKGSERLVKQSAGMHQMKSSKAFLVVDTSLIPSFGSVMFCRLGILVDFLSHSTITGFMGGTALIICLQQLKGMFGLTHFTSHTDVISVLRSVFKYRAEVCILSRPGFLCLFSAFHRLNFLRHSTLNHILRGGGKLQKFPWNLDSHFTMLIYNKNKYLSFSSMIAPSTNDQSNAENTNRLDISVV
jgi:hypothetical protein